MFCFGVRARLDGSTSDTGAILNAALYGLNKIYHPDIPNKKAGGLLLDLNPKEQAPKNLFTKSYPQPLRQTGTFGQCRHSGTEVKVQKSDEPTLSLATPNVNDISSVID